MGVNVYIKFKPLSKVTYNIGIYTFMNKFQYLQNKYIFRIFIYGVSGLFNGWGLGYPTSSFHRLRF